MRSRHRTCQENHRLYSAVTADRILVLEHGRVIESGSHTDLMVKRGAYHAMFDLQAKSYQTNL